MLFELSIMWLKFLGKDKEGDSDDKPSKPTTTEQVTEKSTARTTAGSTVMTSAPHTITTSPPPTMTSSPPPTSAIMSTTPSSTSSSTTSITTTTMETTSRYLWYNSRVVTDFPGIRLHKYVRVWNRNTFR